MPFTLVGFVEAASLVVVVRFGRVELGFGGVALGILAMGVGLLGGLLEIAGDFE